MQPVCFGGTCLPPQKSVQNTDPPAIRTPEHEIMVPPFPVILKTSADPPAGPDSQRHSAQTPPDEFSRRRIFAAVSHPDAGKPALTRKLLLYSGCVINSGGARVRKTRRVVISDKIHQPETTL